MFLKLDCGIEFGQSENFDSSYKECLRNGGKEHGCCLRGQLAKTMSETKIEIFMYYHNAKCLSYKIEKFQTLISKSQRHTIWLINIVYDILNNYITFSEN